MRGHMWRTMLSVLVLLAAWNQGAPAKAQIELQPHRDEVESRALPERAGALTRMPELLVYVDPVYPPELQREEIEGEVVLLLTISAEGLVTLVDVVDSPDPRLSDPAVEAARLLEFTPAEIDGSPAAVQIEFGYVFALDLTELLERSDSQASSLDPEATAHEDWPKMEPVQPDSDDEDDALPQTRGLGDETSRLSTVDVEITEPVTLRGRVLERGLRDPIEDAMVVSGEHVVTSSATGHFELRLESGRSHQIEVRAPGFHHFETTELIEQGERSEVVYYVQRQGTSPYETVVRAQRHRKEVSRVVLSREEARKVPGTFGDPLRVVENLPGMARSPFIGGQLLVRGARPEDTGVYFDGTSIPLLYHFGGLTSVVNAEFLEEIDFLPGGFGAEYGRATAGVVNVTPRRLVGQPARGSAKIDLMDTSLFYRQPVGDSLAFGIAVRRSYIDVFLPLFLNSLTPNSGTIGRVTAAPVYADYQLRVDWNATPRHDLDLFLFGSQDTLELFTGGSGQMHGLELDMRLAFHRATLSHRWRPRPDLVLRTRPFVGMTLQGAGGGETDGQVQFDFALDMLEAGLRQDLAWTMSERLLLRAGTDIYALKGKSALDLPVPSDLLAFPSPMQPTPDNQAFEASDTSWTAALWAETVLEPTAKLQIVPGLRLELYGLPEATWPVLEPRISTRYQMLEGTVLKAAAGRYHKPPTLFEANPVIGNPTLRPERSRHLVAGVEQAITDVLDLDLQVFHNRHADLVVSSSDTTITDGQSTGETYVNSGDGRAYGLEVLLRHKITDRAFGWLAYTLMRSERRSSEESDYVVTAEDQTHILTLVGSYRLGRGFELGARFRLVTGNPYTPVLGATHDLDTDRWRPIYGQTRSARLPTFHQMDLRAEYTRVFDTFKVSAFVDLLNAYNQANVETFQYDYRYRNRVDFNGLPLVPVLGFRGQW